MVVVLQVRGRSYWQTVGISTAYWQAIFTGTGEFQEIRSARPKLQGLANVVLTYSRVSQFVERLFSHVQLTGSKLRNKLECVSIEREMRLIKESPHWQTAKFEDAMNIYFAVRRRGYGMRKTVKRTQKAKEKGSRVLADPANLLWLLKEELDEVGEGEEDIDIPSSDENSDQDSDEEEYDSSDSSSSSSLSDSDSD